MDFPSLRHKRLFDQLSFGSRGTRLVCTYYFAHIIEWEFPDFTVKNSLERLFDAQEILEKEVAVFIFTILIDS